ncbi:Ger(x)C family spore germination protein [Paenibacillus plantiphilus]|nr:Ger(x)C family spore germination protein [Paenibacillus plantiphilus]
MKKQLVMIILAALVATVLSGCWNRAELPEKGFVMGVAIDKTDEGKFKLTTQIYKPAQKTSTQGGGSALSYVIIETEDETLFEAVRDITIQVGRRAQWAHMRVILLGEDVVRKEDIGSVLEYFYRDHEARLTTKVQITRGKAGGYMKVKPKIEQTVSQQMNRIQKAVARNSGKTTDINLLRLAHYLKSEVPNVAIPLASRAKDSQSSIPIAGAAMIKKGKMIGSLSGKSMESLTMLTNQYRKGVLQFMPVPSEKDEIQGVENIEVEEVRTNWKLAIEGDAVRAVLKVNVVGNIGELKYTKLETREDELKLRMQVQQSVKNQLHKIISLLQKKRIDLLDLGNRIYREKPQLWKKWKPDWERRFAESKFDIEVSVDLKSTLTTIGKPFQSR